MFICTVWIFHRLKLDGCRVKQFFERCLKSPSEACFECEMCGEPKPQAKRMSRLLGGMTRENSLCTSCAISLEQF